MLSLTSSVQNCIRGRGERHKKHGMGMKGIQILK